MYTVYGTQVNCYGFDCCYESILATRFALMDGEKPKPEKKSAVLIEVDRADYERLKAAAKARGLTLRGYVRSAALERLREDERR